jgi:hypothetical protein
MYVPQNIQPISGPSFAQIAAELGLVEPSRSRARRSRNAAIPSQRSSRRRQVEVATR